MNKDYESPMAKFLDSIIKMVEKIEKEDNITTTKELKKTLEKRKKRPF